MYYKDNTQYESPLEQVNISIEDTSRVRRNLGRMKIVQLAAVTLDVLDLIVAIN